MVLIGFYLYYKNQIQTEATINITKENIESRQELKKFINHKKIFETLNKYLRQHIFHYPIFK